ERIELVEIAMPSDRRARAAITLTLVIVEALDRPRRETGRGRIFRKLICVWRKVEHDPMHPDTLRSLGIRRVRVVDDERKRLGALGHALEHERWRDVIAFARIARWNLAALLEGWGSERESHRDARTSANEQNVDADEQRSEQKHAGRTRPSHRQPLMRPPAPHPGACRQT